jgi:hypothetical protein
MQDLQRIIPSRDRQISFLAPIIFEHPEQRPTHLRRSYVFSGSTTAVGPRAACAILIKNRQLEIKLAEEKGHNSEHHVSVELGGQFLTLSARQRYLHGDQRSGRYDHHTVAISNPLGDNPPPGNERAKTLKV